MAPPLVAGRYEILGLLGAGGMGTRLPGARHRARRGGRAQDAPRGARRRAGGARALPPRGQARAARDPPERRARRSTSASTRATSSSPWSSSTASRSRRCSTRERLSCRARRRRSPSRHLRRRSARRTRAGVVHRDLKPDNVLAREGRARRRHRLRHRARARAPSGAKTTGGIVGTPAYMAPEQVEGAPDIDARADVYALGVMLYEMLTGERPWQGDVAARHRRGAALRPPPDPRVARRDLPAALAELDAALHGARPARDRLATTDDVARRARDALGGARESLRSRHRAASPRRRRLVSPRPKVEATRPSPFSRFATPAPPRTTTSPKGSPTISSTCSR